MFYDEIVEEVCKHYGCTRNELYSSKRDRHIVNTRKIIFKTLSLLGKSNVWIAKKFGKDHTTVIHSLKKMSKDEMDYANYLYDAYKLKNEILENSGNSDSKIAIIFLRNEIIKRINKDMSVENIADDLKINKQYVYQELRFLEKVKQYKIVPDYKNYNYKKYFLMS